MYGWIGSGGARVSLLPSWKARYVSGSSGCNVLLNVLQPGGKCDLRRSVRSAQMRVRFCKCCYPRNRLEKSRNQPNQTSVGLLGSNKELKRTEKVRTSCNQLFLEMAFSRGHSKKLFRSICSTNGFELKYSPVDGRTIDSIKSFVLTFNF